MTDSEAESNDPRLGRLIVAWPTLPEDVRRQIVDLVTGPRDSD